MIQSLKYFLWLGLWGLLGGCASTSGPKDLGELQYTGFTEKADGTAQQTVLGLTCPAAIGGINRTSTRVYNDQGTDVSCNYSEAVFGSDRILTVYLSQFPQDSLEGNFRAAQYHIENRFKPQGYVFDEELSSQCGSKSIDAASLLSGLLGSSGTDTVTLTPTPAAVYVNQRAGEMTLVTVDEPYEKEFFKTRYTGPYGSVDDVDQICEVIRQNFLDMKSSINAARGIDNVSDLSRLLGGSTDGS